MLKFVTATSRSAVVELTESGKFYTEKPYEIYVDGSKYMDSEKVITTLYGLKPDTLYKVSAVYDGQEIAAVDVQTKYEFVTLNVREFGATATVSMMIPMPFSVRLWHARRIPAC